LVKKGRKKLYDGGILHIRLPAGVLKRIDKLAEKEGITRSDWARRWLTTLVIAQEEEFTALVEKAIEPMKPVFERFGAILKEEIERHPDYIKESLDKAFKTILEELIKRYKEEMKE